MPKPLLSVELGRYLRLAIVAILVTGCATQPPAAPGVAPGSVCCSSMSDFDFRPISPGQEVDVELTATNATFLFGDRPERFVAFRAPNDFKGTAIQYTTYLSNDLFRAETVLIPHFLFFNENYDLVGKTLASDMQVDKGGMFSGLSFSGAVSIAPGTRYVIVVAGAGSGTLHSKDATQYVSGAAFGRLSLRFFGATASR